MHPKDSVVFWKYFAIFRLMERWVAEVAVDFEDENEDDDEYESGSTSPNLVLDNRIFEMDFGIVAFY